MIWIIFIAVLVGFVFVSYLKKAEKGSSLNKDSEIGTISNTQSFDNYTSHIKQTLPYLPLQKSQFCSEGYILSL